MNILWKDYNYKSLTVTIIVLLFLFMVISLFITEENTINRNIQGLFYLSFVLGIIYISYKKIKRGIIKLTWYVFIFLILPLILTIIIPLKVLNILSFLGLIIMILFLLLILYYILRLKLNYITEKGIRVGNAYYNCGNEIFLKQKPIFLEWTKIKSLKIKGKISPGGIISTLNNFLLLETRENHKLECGIKDYNGFINTLKYLKKEKLISKDSKYYDLL